MRLHRDTLGINIKGYIIERDQHTCQICGKVGIPVNRFGKPAVIEIIRPEKVLYIRPYNRYNDRHVRSFHFDHIVPITLGGGNNPVNIQLTCRYCNLAKGARVKCLDH